MIDFGSIGKRLKIGFIWTLLGALVALIAYFVIEPLTAEGRSLLVEGTVAIFLLIGAAHARFAKLSDRDEGT